jgi:hypothetical protein
MLSEQLDDDVACDYRLISRDPKERRRQSFILSPTLDLQKENHFIRILDFRSLDNRATIGLNALRIGGFSATLKCGTNNWTARMPTPQHSLVSEESNWIPLPRIPTRQDKPHSPRMPQSGLR